MNSSKKAKVLTLVHCESGRVKYSQVWLEIEDHHHPGVWLIEYPTTAISINHNPQQQQQQSNYGLILCQLTAGLQSIDPFKAQHASLSDATVFHFLLANSLMSSAHLI